MIHQSIVFGLTNNGELAKKIAEKTGFELGEANITKFADGEILVKSKVAVRSKDVYVVQSTSAPVNDSIMELLIFIDSLKRASAFSINVIIPYYGYARQDRKASGREPITSRLMANLLSVAGVDRVITFDLHSPQIQGFFDVPVDDLRGVVILSKHFRGIDKNNLVIVSPDHGGAPRARKLAEILGEGIPVAIVDKRRIGPNKSEVMNLIGDVEGKIAIIIDDMIDTGGTILEGAKAVLEANATEVHLACTHGVFSGDALQRIQESDIKSLVVTNTIEIKDEHRIDKLKVLDISSFISSVLIAIDKSESISKIIKKMLSE